MKKITSIILASLLALSATASAFAAEVPGSDSKEITATFVQPDPDSVYEVDIIWGSMEFDYNSGLKRVWNPDTLQYSDEVETEPSWTPSDENGDIVTVKNHSNEGVIVEVDYNKDTENGVDGTLTNAYFGLATAENTTVEDAPSNSAQLALSTENMPESFKEGSTNVNVGSLTVTIVEDISTINATAMTNDELSFAIAASLDADADTLNLTLPADASTGTFNVVCHELAMAENIEDGSVTVNLSGVESLPEKAFYLNYEIGAVNIPASATSIGNMAFFSCINLKTVTFEEGSQMKTIADDSFHNCWDLTSVTIPASVTSIGFQAFYNCESLQSLTFEDGIELESIGDSSFRECDMLTSVTIPASVKSIEGYAFMGCIALQTVEFEEGNQLEKIGNSAFMECAITDIDIPETLTILEGQAFNSCENLTSIVIPAGVSEIGNNTFGRSSQLESITFLALEPPTLEQYGLNAVNNLSAIYVPAESVDAYKTADVWSNYSELIKAIQ